MEPEVQLQIMGTQGCQEPNLQEEQEGPKEAVVLLQQQEMELLDNEEAEYHDVTDTEELEDEDIMVDEDLQ